jgi:probable rRNA maturation factor
MESLVTALLRREGRDPDVELSLLFCDDPVIRSLNRDYRGIDRPTDVLSFGQDMDGEEEPVDTALPLSVVLGDVVISLETAERQAEAQRHPPAQEVEWLLLHGTLHLLGYDDATEDGLQSMIERQQAVLQELPAPRRKPRRPPAARAGADR